MEQCRRTGRQLIDNVEVWPVHVQAIYLISPSGDKNLWVSSLDTHIYTYFRNILVAEVSTFLADLNCVFDYFM